MYFFKRENSLTRTEYHFWGKKKIQFQGEVGSSSLVKPRH